MRKLALTFVAGSLLILGSCSKTGPQGPQGNANVKGSDPFDVYSNTWTQSSFENAWMVSFNDPDITSSVAARGDVEIFLYYPGDGTWRNLPDIVGGTEFYSRFSQGGFDIYYGNVDGTAPFNPPSVTYTFRSVVIAPSYKQAHPNTNWKNYDEVMSVLKQENIAAQAN